MNGAANRSRYCCLLLYLEEVVGKTSYSEKEGITLAVDKINEVAANLIHQAVAADYKFWIIFCKPGTCHEDQKALLRFGIQKAYITRTQPRRCMTCTFCRYYRKCFVAYCSEKSGQAMKYHKNNDP